jgi:hypothetical protein
MKKDLCKYWEHYIIKQNEFKRDNYRFDGGKLIQIELQIIIIGQDGVEIWFIQMEICYKK